MKAAMGISGKRSAVAKLLVSIEKYCEENFLFEQMKLGKSAQLILKNRDISDLDRRSCFVLAAKKNALKLPLCYRFILTHIAFMDLSHNRLTSLPSDISR